jgi:hypothetical protein
MKLPAHLKIAVVLTLLSAVAAQAFVDPPPPPMPGEQPWKSGATTVTVEPGTFRVKGFGPMENYGPEGGYSQWDLAAWHNELPRFYNMVVEEGVTHIGDFLFERSSCHLQSVIIPASVASIGENAFTGCYQLTSIKVAPDNTRYCSVDDVVFSKDKTTLILYPIGRQGSYTIPNSVTAIGEGAFFNAGNLDSVTIPNSVTAIGEHAFGGCCRKTSITIPNSVTAIGKYAFAGYKMGYSIFGPSSVIETYHEYRFECCRPTETVSIAIPNSVTAIEDYTFAGACLESIIIPNSVTAIGEGAFRDCKRLTSVTIPQSVKSIGKDAFKFCEGLTSVTIKEGVTAIGDYAFAGCKSLRHVIIPNSVVSIGDYAFAGCDSLTYLTIEKGVKRIGMYAFFGCRSLRSVTIPSGVAKIETGTFHGCWELRSVAIPSSVTAIGEDAFFNDGLIATVAVRSLKPPYMRSGAFHDSWKDARLYVPAISILAYRSADLWDEFNRFRPVEFYEMSVAKIVSLSILTVLALSAAVFGVIKKLRKSSV